MRKGEPADGPETPGEKRNILDDLRTLREAIAATLRDGGDVAGGFAKLVSADAALARSAVATAALLGIVALLLLHSTWLLLLGVLVTGLAALGLNWVAAFAVGAGILLLASALVAWLAWRALADARFDATRRQWARLRSTSPNAPPTGAPADGAAPEAAP
ncbi:hypothetical protein [Coralloluteibacterium thermophilus]|uniref:Phage holin family protein n=1 Tax=Coralloluteibacterium thermophilum TaxID=2707049 RepID=A0ABV9NIM4_9GAMM